MSRFLEIYEEVKENISSKKFQPGDILPSENDLTHTFGVSRGTVRKALSLLVEKGYIQKIQGKGSVVLDIQRFDLPLTGLTSYKELQQAQQIDSETIVLNNGLVTLPEAVSRFLSVSPNTEAVYVRRIRRVNGENVILDIDYFLSSIVSFIPKEAAENSLYEYIEGTLKLPISYARKEFTVEEATDADRKHLFLKDDTHVVVTRSETFLEDTRLFQYSESRHRLDTFRFTDFVRRRSLSLSK